MAWVTKVLFIGALPTTLAEIYNPIYPTIVRGIRVSNITSSDANVVVSIYLASPSAEAPIITENLTLGAQESAEQDTPITLSPNGDSIKAVADTSETSCTIWGVVDV